MFDGFFNTYLRRIRDLIRIATGGSGVLPAGDLHPDLINRIAGEASRTAQAVLTMCIRAFDYLPPVDVTFGDYLRSLVTADFELNPVDEFGQRELMIAASSGTLRLWREESLLWPGVSDLPPLPIRSDNNLTAYVLQAATSFGSAGKPAPASAIRR